jgi:predicted nuclease of predicted toxin-antitoxin system
MRFLVDAQLPAALARWLAAEGHRAEHVADIGLAGALDKEIGTSRSPQAPSL